MIHIPNLEHSLIAFLPSPTQRQDYQPPRYFALESHTFLPEKYSIISISKNITITYNEKIVLLFTNTSNMTLTYQDLTVNLDT